MNWFVKYSTPIRLVAFMFWLVPGADKGSREKLMGELGLVFQLVLVVAMMQKLGRKAPNAVTEVPGA